MPFAMVYKGVTTAVAGGLLKKATGFLVRPAENAIRARMRVGFRRELALRLVTVKY